MNRKISPTYSNYFDQFVPNWNSWVMPVTTPRVKFIVKAYPRIAPALFPEFVAAHDIARFHPGNDDGRPNVSGKKMK